MRRLAGVLPLALCAGCTALAQRGFVNRDAYELRVEGNRHFSDRELARAAIDDLNDFAAHGFKKSAVDDAAYAMEIAYRRDGFPFATASYELLPAAKDRRPALLFQVVEGRRVALDGVAFEGNREIAAETLAEYFPSGGWYVEAEVDAGARALRAFYAAQGFLDARVDDPEVELDAQRTSARVRVAIHEGTRYRLADVELLGELLYPLEQVRRAFAAEIGRPYRLRQTFEIQARLEELYADRGHADVSVEPRPPSIDAAAGDVRLAFEVDPGPVVVLNAVRFEHDGDTSEEFLRSRLTLGPGDRYSRKAVRASFERLYRTGLFEHLEIATEPATGSERALVVRAKELSSLELFVEPGWGSYELARLTLGLQEKNLFGTGRILRAEGTAAVRAQTGKVTLIDPWLFGSDFTGDAVVFGNRRQEPSFLRLELGTGLNVSRRWSAAFRTAAGYELRRSDVDDVEVTAPASIASDDVNISALSFEPSYDTRDSLLRPTDGSLSNAKLEWAGDAIGSELEFVRLAVEHAQYLRLGSVGVVGLSARTGVIRPIGATDEIPLQERYFNGGENTVRSFKEDELGPKDVNGEPVGGETYTVLSAELRRRLFGHFAAALFYDTGNVLLEAGDYFTFDDFRTGVGTGLRYELPVGPVRLDFAVNPSPRDDEDEWVLHFALGLSY